jgi:branched-chain amino acid transport system substrate-binding protein
MVETKSFRYRRMLLAMVVACMAVVGVAACGSGGSTDATTGSGGDSGETADDTSPIGIAALVGPVAEGGPDFVNGMRTEISAINGEGGVDGHMLKLATFDTEGTPAGAVSAYRQAGQDEEVDAAFFAAVTGALGLKGQSESAQLPIVIATASEELDDPVARYTFHDSFGGEYATSSISYASDQYDAKRIAVLHYGTDYSVGITPAIEERCEELGCEVVSEQSGEGAESADALVPALTKMRAADPDVYFIEGLNPAAFAAAGQLGIEEPIVSDQWLAIPALRDACGADCDGVTFAIHKANVPELITADDPLADVFTGYREAYEEETGEWAGFSVYGRDAVAAVAQAAEVLVEEGKEINRENLAVAMESFDGNLTTTHGVVVTSPDDHRLVGEFDQAYVDVSIESDGKKTAWVLAPGADPEGSTP